jgi:TetR/AcrR family transcriptional regulator, repressor for uid operon
LGKARRGYKNDSAQNILKAAGRCFARHGYHQTSIKIIAAEADIRSPSILHYHFQNKEAIFLAVMRQTLGSITERATEIGLSSREKTRGLGALEAFFALIDEEQDLPALFMECMSMAARSQTNREELSALLYGLESMVEDAIRQLLGEYASRLPLDPHTLAGTIVDLMTGHAMRTTLLADDEIKSRRRGILSLLGSLRPLEKPQSQTKER